MSLQEVVPYLNGLSYGADHFLGILRKFNNKNNNNINYYYYYYYYYYYDSVVPATYYYNDKCATIYLFFFTIVAFNYYESKFDFVKFFCKNILRITSTFNKTSTWK